MAGAELLGSFAGAEAGLAKLREEAAQRGLSLGDLLRERRTQKAGVEATEQAVPLTSTGAQETVAHAGWTPAKLGRTPLAPWSVYDSEKSVVTDAEREALFPREKPWWEGIAASRAEPLPVRSDSALAGSDSAPAIAAVRDELDDVLFRIKRGGTTEVDLDAVRQQLQHIQEQLAAPDFGTRPDTAHSFAAEVMVTLRPALEKLEEVWRWEGVTEEGVKLLRDRATLEFYDLAEAKATGSLLREEVDYARLMTDPARINERALQAPIEFSEHMRMHVRNLRKEGHVAMPVPAYEKLDEIVLREKESLYTPAARLAKLQFELGGDPGYDHIKRRGLREALGTLPWVEDVHEHNPEEERKLWVDGKDPAAVPASHEAGTYTVWVDVKPGQIVPLWIVHPRAAS